jgi:hypothetical protein
MFTSGNIFICSLGYVFHHVLAVQCNGYASSPVLIGQQVHIPQWLSEFSFGHILARGACPKHAQYYDSGNMICVQTRYG